MLMQILVPGLLQGVIYALIGLGLFLIFNVMRVVNFAHGYFVLIGMYGLLWLNPQTLMAYALGTVGIVAGAAIFGYAVERWLLEFTLHKPGHAQLVITISLGIAMQYLFQIQFPEPYQRISNPWPFSSIEIFGVPIAAGRLMAAIISLALTLAISWVVYRTSLGQYIRACSQSLPGAVHVGINFPRVYRSTFAFGAGIAAIAGALLIPFQPVSPHFGLDLTIKAFIIVVIGGGASIWGTVIAGVLLGMAEAAGSVFGLGSMTSSVIYLLFLLVIVVRPQGLIVRKAAFA